MANGKVITGYSQPNVAKYSFANNTDRYQVLTVVTSNATSFNTVSAWYMAQAGTNAWSQYNGNVTRYNIIREIWGVKYV